MFFLFMGREICDTLLHLSADCSFSCMFLLRFVVLFSGSGSWSISVWLCILVVHMKESKDVYDSLMLSNSLLRFTYF